jgi:hypothetical protein
MDLKNLKARKVLSFDSPDSGLDITVFHDQSTMLVNKDSDSAPTDTRPSVGENDVIQTQHRVDLATFKTTVRQVRQFDLAGKGVTDCIPCPDGKTKVLIERGKLLAASPERKDLGLLNAVFDGMPNLEKSPTFLTVYTRADPSPKFTVGENLEIHLLDLKTLKFIRLADAPGPTQQAEGWSTDGRYFFWTREETVNDDVPTCLYVHDIQTGKTRRLTQTETTVGPLVVRDGYLPAGVEDAIPANGGQEKSVARLCTIDLLADSLKPVPLLDHVPDKWDVWGRMVIYRDKESDSPLGLVPLPTREPPAKPHGAGTTSAPAR